MCAVSRDAGDSPPSEIFGARRFRVFLVTRSSFSGTYSKVSLSMPDPMPIVAPLNDAELVAATLAGDRRAFGVIVERYQRLLCSLAYSATGELSQSEDLAQEAFVEAWRQLPQLREPDKLRAWLCGILRFKISRRRRADGREPVRQADGLEAAPDIDSGDTGAADLAMRHEEQALMWSALARVPENYREPLILYYRENRSIEHVAAALELTEDTVKQRLLRGRRILQEQMLAFVEGALARSTPGRVFTIGVLAALPEWGTPAKAAGVGVAAAQGGLLAKSTSLAALLASVSGLVSAVLTLRANLDQSRTPHERRLVVRVTAAAFLGFAAFFAALIALKSAALGDPSRRLACAVLSQAVIFVGILAWSVLLPRAMRTARELRTAERRRQPDLFRDSRDHRGSVAGEFCSQAKLFGVPLVRIRFSSPDEGEPPVFAWIAGGDRAVGLLCAWGAVAVAPFSIGALSVGVVSIGSLGVGVVALGTIGVGFLALGATAFGVHASAWLSALGWQTAQSSGFAIAGSAALGPLAFAPHANDAVAQHHLAASSGGDYGTLVLMIAALASVVPIACYARAVRQRLGRPSR